MATLEEKIERGEHPLFEPFVMSLFSSEPLATEDGNVDMVKGAVNCNVYLSNIHHLFKVETVEDFWRNYQFLLPLERLPSTQRFQFHCDGVNLMYEDPHLSPVGLRARYDLEPKDHADALGNLWERLVLGVISGELLYREVKDPEEIELLSKSKIVDKPSVSYTEIVNGANGPEKTIYRCAMSNGETRFYKRIPLAGIEINNTQRKTMDIWMFSDDREYLQEKLESIINLPKNIIPQITPVNKSIRNQSSKKNDTQSVPSGNNPNVRGK